MFKQLFLNSKVPGDEKLEFRTTTEDSLKASDFQWETPKGAIPMGKQIILME